MNHDIPKGAHPLATAKARIQGRLSHSMPDEERAALKSELAELHRRQKLLNKQQWSRRRQHEWERRIAIDSGMPDGEYEDENECVG